MGIIPPVNPLFYMLAFLMFLLLILTLIALLRSNKRTRRVKALFFGSACYLQLVTIAYPIWLYSNKPAPLASSSLLIGFGQGGSIVALNARDGSVRWRQPFPGTWVWTLVTGGPGKVFYTASQTTDGGSVLTANTASDGTQMWRTALLPQHSYGKLEQLMTSNGFVYVDEAIGESDEVVYALRANDGTLAWKHAAHMPDELGEATNPLLKRVSCLSVQLHKRRPSFFDLMMWWTPTKVKYTTTPTSLATTANQTRVLCWTTVSFAFLDH